MKLKPDHALTQDSMNSALLINYKRNPLKQANTKYNKRVFIIFGLTTSPLTVNY